MLTIFLQKYLRSLLLATVIQGFSTKLGIFKIVNDFFFINLIYTIIVNILITLIATFFFWEIFRVFENYKIEQYCKTLPHLIKLHKDSIIPPGFMLHWKLFSLRTFYILTLTGFAEGGFILAQYMSPYVAENFITIFTHISYFMDIYLFFEYDWILKLPLQEIPRIIDEDFLSPPLPFEEVRVITDVKIQNYNALIEQKKTLIRGFFSIHTALFIGSIALCEAIYMFYN
jgi:hypothetical protein